MTDRELDALVATKVMGWERRGDDDWCKPLHKPDGDDDGGEKGPHPRLVPPGKTFEERRERTVFLCRCGPDIEFCDRLPFFSTDVAAAWAVVQRMHWLGYDVCVEAMACSEDWKATIGDAVEVDEIAPPAICLAALRALRVEGVLPTPTPQDAPNYRVGEVSVPVNRAAKKKGV